MGHHTEGVGELDFSAFAGLGLFQHVENVRGDDVATQSGELGRRFLDGRFFYHVLHGDQVRIFGGDAVHDAVGGHLVFRDDLAADDGAAGLVVLRHQLCESGGAAPIVHHVVAQDDAEGFVVDEILRAQDSIAEASHVRLAGVMDFHRCHLADFFQKVHLTGFVEMFFQLRG